MWSAGVETPIPRGKHEDVDEPQPDRRAKKRERRDPLGGKGGDQDSKREDQSRGNDAGKADTKPISKRRASRAMRGHSWHKQHGHNDQKKPARPGGQVFRKYGVESPGRENSGNSRPKRLTLYWRGPATGG